MFNLRRVKVFLSVWVHISKKKEKKREKKKRKRTKKPFHLNHSRHQIPNTKDILSQKVVGYQPVT